MLAAMVAVATSCGPKEDKTLIELTDYVTAQDQPGLYSNGVAEYVFNHEDGQCYINTSRLMFRIQNNTANKYFQVELSEAPVVGKSVNVVAKSKGVGLSTNITYNGMVVEKIEDGLCYLVGGESVNYKAIIIGWVE